MEIGYLVGQTNDLELYRVYEETYTIHHPQVIFWEHELRKRADINGIFRGINQKLLFPGKNTAIAVGASWAEFSNIVPFVLCSLATKAKSNLLRHYLIQTTFEELGGRNHKAIHANLFRNALYTVKILESELSDYFSKTCWKTSLDFLVNELSNINSNSEAIGFALGLELPANENISTLLEGISYDNEKMENLLRTPFFKIHKIVEDEHIRLSISNFLRFCGTTSEKQLCLQTFDKIITFWKFFWEETSSSID